MAKASAEQINAAMEAMAAEGQAITVRALRERLGNGACLGTISKLLQRRKAGAQRQIAAAAELSPVLQQAILDYVGQELSASHSAHEAEMNDNQQELMDLASENERQQELLELQTGELETLRAELERERQVANQARMDLAKAQFKLEGIPRLEEAAEAARAELIQAQLKLESLTRVETELASVRLELEAEREELGETRAELDEERTLRIKAQQFIVDPIFKTPV